MRAPRFADPLLLTTPLPLRGAQAQARSRDRWPVAGLPLGAKQRRGAARPCVCAPERRQRLPAVALLAGSPLAPAAAPPPPLSTRPPGRAPPPPPRARRPPPPPPHRPP